uniref:Uncharacterized protein n=1 Tax=Oryza barthii TaxID=65489 RepID=A0A0D3H350_9ORYZ
MRELSCFGDSSVGIAAAAAGDSGRGGALDRKLQAATTAVYGASLHFGKELLIRVTWTQNAAGATGLAVVEVHPPCAAQEAREQVLATATGTAVGVHWDTAEATYASDSFIQSKQKRFAFSATMLSTNDSHESSSRSNTRKTILSPSSPPPPPSRAPAASCLLFPRRRLHYDTRPTD